MTPTLKQDDGRQLVGNLAQLDYSSDGPSEETLVLQDEVQDLTMCQDGQSDVGILPEELLHPVLVEQTQLSGNGESFKSLVAEMDMQGGVWLLPQDNATIYQVEIINDVLDETSEEPEMEVSVSLTPPKDSCWMVVQPRPLRVRIEHNLKGGLVVVRSIDYGFSMSVPSKQLRALPVNLRTAWGMAVYGRLSLSSLNRKVVQGDECTAVVENGKVTLVLDEVHDQLKDESCEGTFWDPMAAHHANLNKQLENDLDKELEGYTSSRTICAFYKNRGSCWKENFCEDLHVLPRHGAVTVDTEISVMVSNYSDLVPAVSRRWVGGHCQHTVEAQFVSALSLTLYYLTFPCGLEGVVGDRGQYQHWWQNFQQFYSQHSSRLKLKALPCPGKFYVAGCCRSGWHRVLILEDVLDDHVVVLLVDEGKQDVVELSSVYDLEDSFGQLPHQAVLCSLRGVEPVSTDVNANDTLVPLFKNSYLSVQPSVDLERPLLVEVMLGNQRLSDLLVLRGLVKKVSCD